jgi:DNA-binding beta-propeller fold protein YncE
MWTDRDQELIYQTNWFDTFLTTFDRETGEEVAHVEVGEAPAHVMTRTDTDEVHVSINGGDTVAELSPGGEEVERQIKVSNKKDGPAQPHAHWMGFDGKTMVTPNSNTADSSLYSFSKEKLQSKVATGDLPIATGMMPDSSKYYVSNFLDSTTSVVKIDANQKAKRISNIDLLQNYDPISGEIEDTNDDGVPDWGALPIQTPVSPDGRFVFTANTLSNTVTIIDTESDELVKALKCDAGCHGVNFGAKEGGGYYAYVSSKFANTLIIIDVDPNDDGDAEDAEIVGRVALTAGDDTEQEVGNEAEDYEGMGGQGVLPIPLVYNGWVQNLPNEWKDELTDDQLDPLG